jgi:hypothetical protein
LRRFLRQDNINRFKRILQNWVNLCAFPKHHIPRNSRKKVANDIKKLFRNYLISTSEDTFINVWEVKENDIQLVVSYHMTDSMIFGMTMNDPVSFFVVAYDTNEIIKLVLN